MILSSAQQQTQPVIVGVQSARLRAVQRTSNHVYVQCCVCVKLFVCKSESGSHVYHGHVGLVVW